MYMKATISNLPTIMFNARITFDVASRSILVTPTERPPFVIAATDSKYASVKSESLAHYVKCRKI